MTEAEPPHTTADSIDSDDKLREVLIVIISEYRDEYSIDELGDRLVAMHRSLDDHAHVLTRTILGCTSVQSATWTCGALYTDTYPVDCFTLLLDLAKILRTEGYDAFADEPTGDVP